MVVDDAGTAHGSKQQATGGAPHVVVMFGATGDLARRKLLPGLFHLSCSNLAPEIRIIGTSLDEIDNETFRKLVSKACHENSSHDISDDVLDQFTTNLIYVPLHDGPERLPRAVGDKTDALGAE